jgi:hypothetical protein
MGRPTVLLPEALAALTGELWQEALAILCTTVHLCTTHILDQHAKAQWRQDAKWQITLEKWSHGMWLLQGHLAETINL